MSSIQSLVKSYFYSFFCYHFAVKESCVKRNLLRVSVDPLTGDSGNLPMNPDGRYPTRICSPSVFPHEYLDYLYTGYLFHGHII